MIVLVIILSIACACAMKIARGTVVFPFTVAFLTVIIIAVVISYVGKWMKNKKRR